MTRKEVLETLEKAQDSVSFKYTHREEVNKAFAIARADIRLVQELVEITENDLNGKDLDNAIKELQRLRKKGEWIPKEDKGQKETVYQCSVCGAEFVSDGIDFRYCPRCGSNMRGKD